MDRDWIMEECGTQVAHIRTEPFAPPCMGAR